MADAPVSQMVWSKDPNGKVTQIDASNLADAGQAGWTTPSVDEVRRARLGEEYGGLKGKLIAAGTGAASALTGGLSDVLAAKTGHKTMVNVSQEENPVSHLAGEAAGFIAPGLGELGITMQAANAAKGLARSAVGEGGGLLARAGRAAVMGVAEAPAFAAKQLVTESALGDPSHVAEDILPTLGENALAFGAFGVGGELLASAAKPVMQGLGKAVEKLQDMASRPVEPDVHGPARELVGAISDARKGIKEAGAAFGDIRGASRESLLSDVPVASAEAFAQKEVGGIIDKLQEMRLDDDIFSKGVTNKLDNKVRGVVERLKSAKTTHEIYEELDTLKGHLYDISGVSAKTLPSPIAQDAVNAIEDMAFSLKRGLEDSSVWGEAGAAQAELNGAHSALMSADESLMDAMGMGKKGRKVPSPSKIVSWMKNGDASTQDAKKAAFEQWTSAVSDYHETLSKFSGQTGVRVGDDAVEGLKGLVDRNMKAAENVQSFSGQMKDFQAEQAKLAGSPFGGHGGSGLASAALFLTGHMHLAGIGLALKYGAKAADFLLKTEKGAAVLGKLASMQQESLKAMDAGVSKIVSGAKGATGVAARAASSYVSQRDETVKRIDDQNMLAGDPQSLVDRAAQVTQHLADDAPAVQGATAAAFVKQSQFLSSKAPKTSIQTPFGPQKVKVTAQELQKFNQYEQVAKDPMKVLDHVHDGTLTSAHMETMRVLYPEKLRQMQTLLVNELTGMTPAQRASIKGPKLTSISAFLGVPLSPALTPGYAGMAAGIYGKQSSMPKAPKLSGAGMKSSQAWGTRQDRIKLGLH